MISTTDTILAKLLTEACDTSLSMDKRVSAVSRATAVMILAATKIEHKDTTYSEKEKEAFVERLGLHLSQAAGALGTIVARIAILGTDCCIPHTILEALGALDENKKDACGPALH